MTIFTDFFQADNRLSSVKPRVFADICVKLRIFTQFSFVTLRGSARTYQLGVLHTVQNLLLNPYAK